MRNNDGFDLQKVDETKIYYNLVWKNSQLGIHLMDVDETVWIDNCHICESSTGVYVRRVNPVISYSTLVCSRVNLYVEGPGTVNAANNHPPIVNVREDDEPCLDSDICYDGQYSGTPMPIWEPDRIRSGCRNVLIMPQINLMELPAELERVRATAGMSTSLLSSDSKWR